MRRLLSVLILLILLTPAAHACPYCADTIHTTSAQSASALGGAFNVSIYCMFLGLLLAFGIIARAIFQGIQRGKKE